MLRLLAFWSALLGLAWLPLASGTGAMGCTAMGITPGATEDGSSLTSHTADCAQCDSRLLYVAARDWPAGAKRPVYVQRPEYPRYVAPERSPVYAPVDGQELDKPAGFVPQVSHTYGYWESSYAYLNEHGLTVAESTCAAFFVNKQGPSLFPIRELTQIAQERCKTARCAVKTMGTLAEEHGFYGEDPGQPGAGEALILSDGKEVWVFHISGDPTGHSAFWVAARVPDGHIAVVANNFVIREVDCEDNSRFLCSSGLVEKATAAGAWDGSKPFDWAVAMGPDIRNFSYTPGFSPIPHYTTARLWRVYSRVAPSLGLRLTDNPRAIAFSVPVDTPLTARGVMDLDRDHYEGTEIDLTVGAFAGPFGSPNRNNNGVGMQLTGGQFARAISIQRTSTCAVVQSYGEMDSATKGLSKLWFAPDAPASSVFAPFYVNATRFHEAYQIGYMAKYDERSAWWVFDFVANWMDLNYRLMRVDVEAKLAELQDHIDRLRGPAERKALALWHEGDTAGASEVLSGFQEPLQRHVVDTWREFGRFLIVKYNDGFLNFPTLGQDIGYPAWWLQMFNLSTDITPHWGRPSATPPFFFTELGPGPFETTPAVGRLSVPPTPSAALAPAVVTCTAVVAGTALFATGLGLGLFLGRRSSAAVKVDDSWGSTPYRAAPVI